MAENLTSTDEILDLRGLKCPLPALLARRTLLRAEPGAKVIVLADDPLAAVDIPHMCHQEGFSVLVTSQAGTEVRISICKGAALGDNTAPPA